MSSPTGQICVRGEAILYRLFDVGYEVRLDQAFDLLASSAPERPKPVRGEARAIQIQNPPVSVQLGLESVDIGGRVQRVEVSARVFDFGVISLRARLPAPDHLPWDEFVGFGVAAGASSAWGLFEHCRDRVLERIRPAIERPEVSAVSEEYIAYRLHHVEDASGRPLKPGSLGDDEIARLLVGEARSLSEGVRREVVSNRFSYFDDDMAVVSWSAALVVESVPEDTDVQYVLEFANAQLLELRYYDALLDKELPRTYDEIEAARGRFHIVGGGSATSWPSSRPGSPTPPKRWSASRTRSRSRRTFSWRASTAPRWRPSGRRRGDGESTGRSRSCGTPTPC